MDAVTDRQKQIKTLLKRLMLVNDFGCSCTLSWPARCLQCKKRDELIDKLEELEFWED